MLLRLRIATVLIAATLPLFAGETLSATVTDEPVPVPVVGEDVEDLIITGRRPEGMSLQKFMLNFVAEIGDPTSDNQGFARWRDKVCVEVRGITDRDIAQYVADRVSAVALEVELTPGAPGCRPNLHIIFAPDGRDLASRLVETRRSVLRPYGGTGGTTQGLQALEEFATSDAPVRWWQVTMLVDRLGNVAIELPNQMDGPPMIAGSNSRITHSVNGELWGTYVIVDAKRLGTVSWPQLTDYIAMVSLAQVRPEGVPSGYDSILNLFNSTNPAAGLTEMDRTYLRALYRMDNNRMPTMQRSLLASTMVREQDKMAKEQEGE